MTAESNAPREVSAGKEDAGKPADRGRPVNRQVRLASRPSGLPGPECWEHTSESVGVPTEGTFLVEVGHISLDPAMRGWMNAGRSYVPPVEIGEVMRALAAGTVVASRHPGFAVGDAVTGTFGVQEYAVSDGAGVQRIDPSAVPVPTYLSALGMTGLTAYFGLLDVGAFQEGDVVLVSGAAGAVGSIVGQIAKLKGASRVVGIAGGPQKCAWLVDEAGFDAAIDYKAGGLRDAVREQAPKGIDIYFDNVGGETLDVALGALRRHARVVICGAISQYNATGKPTGPANYLSLLVNRARMEGFVVFDYADRYGDAAAEIAGWLASGALRSREDVVAGGVDDFPATLLRLFSGDNQGKLVLELTAP